MATCSPRQSYMNLESKVCELEGASNIGRKNLYEFKVSNAYSQILAKRIRKMYVKNLSC